MKIKLDKSELGILINGLHQDRLANDDEIRDKIDDILLYLLDEYNLMKPRRKRKIVFESSQIPIIVMCLNDWRNTFISEGKSERAFCVGAVLLLFC